MLKSLDYLNKIALEKSYFETDRDCSTGPRLINTSLELQENIYSLAYVYLLKSIQFDDDVSDVEDMDARETGIDEDVQQNQTDGADNNSVNEDSQEKL